MGEIIAVVSGKGGVGKTTVVANLGKSLVDCGKKVLLIDMDMGLRNLDMVLGLESGVVYDILDMIESGGDEAVMKAGGSGNLYFLPAPQTRDNTSITPEQTKKIYEKLSESYDYILIDSPAGIERGFYNAVSGVKEAILVTTADMVAVRDADRVAGILDNMGIGKMRVVINRFRPDFVESEVQLNLDNCLELLSVPLLGVVPEDDCVVISSAKGESVFEHYPASQAAVAYRNISYRMMGESVPIMDLEKSADGFWQKMKRFFSSRK